MRIADSASRFQLGVKSRDKLNKRNEAQMPLCTRNDPEARRKTIMKITAKERRLRCHQNISSESTRSLGYEESL